MGNKSPHHKSSHCTTSAKQSKRVFIILLAAGESSRLGQSKQLIDIDGQSLLEDRINMLTQMDASVYLVLGAQHQNIEQHISLAALEKCRCLVNRDWQKGMGSSLSLAIKSIELEFPALKACTDMAMIVLADQWRLSANSLRHFVEKASANSHLIHASHCKDWRGPPVIFPRAYWPELKKLQNHGAKSLIKRYQHDICWHLTENCHLDLDTPSDLEQMNAYYRSVNNAQTND